MSKVDTLLEQVELELNNASIDQISEVLSKCQSRISGVIDNPAPHDSEDTLSQLKEVLNNLESSILILSQISRKTDNGKQ